MKTNQSIKLRTSIHKPSIWPMALLAAATAAILACIAAPQARATATVSFGIDVGNQSGQNYLVSPYMDADRIEASATYISNGNFNATGYFWSATNTQVVALYTNAGIRLISIGGSSVDGKNSEPRTNDIAQFFSFAQAANLMVDWTVGMSNVTDPGTLIFTNVDMTNSLFIMQNYSNNLLFLSIGNERDGKSDFGTNYSGGNGGFEKFWPYWGTYYTNIVDNLKANGAPVPAFGGDDSVVGSTAWWAEWWAATNYASGIDNVADINFHYEPYYHSTNDTEFEDALDLLSSNTDESAAEFPKETGIISYQYNGMNFNASLTEFNGFNSGNGTGAPGNDSNGYCNSLFALDAIHWWAQQGLYSLNWLDAHNTFFYTNQSNGNLEGAALMYACAAYNLGGGADAYAALQIPNGPGYHGVGMALTNWSNPSGVNNATAYAIADYNPATGHCTNLYVTIINTSMTSPPSGRWETNILADFTVGMPYPGVTRIHRMVLEEGGGLNYVTATNSITLGNADLNGAGPFQPQWEDVGVLNYPYYKPTVTNLTAQIIEFSCPTN